MKNAFKYAAVSLIVLGGAAHAQTTTVQRDVNQQQRIEQGLKSGELTTKEAGKLEREESKVQKDQAHVLSDGNMSNAERARLTREQDKVSHDITREKHDGAVGNPDSPSSKRMQADVQRNINQQQRIENGVKDGSLTNHEAAHMEGREAHVDGMEAKAAGNGHVGAREQRRIEHADNRDSRAIYRQRHDNQVR